MTIFGRQTQKKAKIAWAQCCALTRLTEVTLNVRRWLSGSAPVAILTYHRILPEDQCRSVYSTSHIITTLQDFEAQIRFLARRYRVLTLEGYAELRCNPAPMPLKCVIITFDDGWRDNYLHAFPVLRKYKVPATIFVTTGFIGKKYVFWQEWLRFLLQNLADKNLTGRESLPEELRPWTKPIFRIIGADEPSAVAASIIRELKGRGGETRGQLLVEALNRFLGEPEFPVDRHAFLTWDQIREMAQHDISFGSHTHRHRLLAYIPEEEVQAEITESKRRLETEIGRDIAAFAYPDGRYRPEIVNRLEAVGYRLAVTTTPGLNALGTPVYQLRRINMCSERFQGLDGRFSEALFAARLGGMLK